MAATRISQEALRRQLMRQSRWFAPRQHVWLKCTPHVHDRTWRIQWGLTAEGMDRLGDITKLERLVDKNNHARQGHDVLAVAWEGYEWTEADELYHTVWESVEGIERIASPVTGRLVHVADSDTSVIDEDIIWAEVECQADDVARAAAHWVDESAYLEWVNTLGPSKFSDPAETA